MICPRCGAPVTPADKFCAICASPIAAQGAPLPPGFGAPPPAPTPGFAPPPAAPGFNPQPGLGVPPDFAAPPGLGPQQPFGGPAAPPHDYGAPQHGFGPPPQGFGPPQGYGPPQPQGYAPPQPQGYAPPQPFGPPPPGYGPPQGYGAPQPPALAFAPQPQAEGGYGPPAQPAPHGVPGPAAAGPGGPRCVQGHAVPPGGSFCMEGGHPIALEGVRFSSGDAFGATAFAPSPGPGAPPMPPTGAMSGYGAEAPAAAHEPHAQPAAEPAVAERRALAGFLVSFQDDPLGKFWPLWQGKNTVGRAETGQRVDVAIGHGTTSTHHATIEADGPRLMLIDLGSTNGTFHNEEAIGFQGRRDVRDGDSIRFGGYSVIVLAASPRT